MDTLKKAMRNYWLLSAFCIVMGGALIWKPGIFTDIVGLVVGGLMAVYGAVTLVRYFLRANNIRHRRRVHHGKTRFHT